MQRVVIIGAGGQGREVADILHDRSRLGEEISVVGFVDDDARLHGREVHDLPVLGDWSWFEGVDRREVAVICAVGAPEVGARLVQRARSLGLCFTNAISPAAHLSTRARLGAGVAVFPQAVVQTEAHLEDHCIVNVSATVSHDTTVGRLANINPGAHLAGNVAIGEGCFIGMGASVIQGRSVGAWAVVGAGAVVIHDLPAGVTAVGVPARVVRARDGAGAEPDAGPGFPANTRRGR